MAGNRSPPSRTPSWAQLAADAPQQAANCIAPVDQDVKQTALRLQDGAAQGAALAMPEDTAGAAALACLTGGRPRNGTGDYEWSGVR